LKLASLVLLMVLATVTARADTPREAYLISAPEAATLEPLALHFLAQHHVSATPLTAPLPAPAPGFPEHELAALTAAEQALVSARSLASELAEGRALLVLVEAERALREHLELPLAHVFLAELYVQTALVAASLGERGLAETSLRRAATLDAQRSLQAGEAAPNLLALARDIERARDSSPRSRVRVESSPEGAEVLVDGVLAGRAPCSVETAPGMHVLVVREPGQHTFATTLELEAGERAPIQVVLAMNAAESARQAALNQAARGLDVRATLLALTPEPYARLWLFEPDARAHGLSVFACTPEGCRQQATLHGAEHASALPLREQEPGRPRWKRWPLWLGVGLGVAALVTTSALVLARDDATRHERVLTIDPGSLPSGR
jgi:hypothetical protein